MTKIYFLSIIIKIYFHPIIEKVNIYIIHRKGTSELLQILGKLKNGNILQEETSGEIFPKVFYRKHFRTIFELIAHVDAKFCYQ